MENNLPIRVFDLFQPGSILRLLNGEAIGTLINSSPEPVETSAKNR